MSIQCRMCNIAQYLAPGRKCELHRMKGAPAGYQNPEWSCGCRVCRGEGVNQCGCRVCRWRARGKRAIPTTYPKGTTQVKPCCRGFVEQTNVFFETVDDDWFEAWLDATPGDTASVGDTASGTAGDVCECTFTTIKGCANIHYIGSVWCGCGISCQCDCNCCMENEHERCYIKSS